MKRFALVFLCLVFAVVPTFAQDDAPTRRDPAVLASDYRGYDGAISVPPLPDTYAVGDTGEFWVATTTSPTPVRVSATLAAVALDAYVWIEDGVNAGDAALGTVAEQVGSLWSTLRLRANYVQRAPLPVQGDASSFVDLTDLLPVPDVDGDPRLHILYARDLREDFGYNPADSLLAPLAPTEASNTREILYINTTPFAGVGLDDGLYVYGMIRALYTLTITYNVPEQAAWLTEALSSNVIQQIQEVALAPADIDSYFSAPDTTTFLRPSTFANRGAVNAAQQMFLGYLVQQYGAETFRTLFLAPGLGLSAVEAALAAGNFTDPTTGAPVTARDLFADFVVANVINAPIGDGRYVHSVTTLAQGQFPRLNRAETLPFTAENAAVAQFGATYTLYLTGDAPETIAVAFDGAATTPRLSMADQASDDAFYWSGVGADARRTLTRSFDLADTESPELTFSAWYDLSDGWNYTYVSVSADGGATWDILTPEYAGASTNTAGIAPRNPHGVAYGAGFTGISNPAGAQPFPIIGVVIQGDGFTLGEVSPGGPADQAGILPGDLVIGYDSAEWERTPDIIGLLTRYNPGDTLNLTIQRGGERLDVPVVLGAHPTRIRQPEPMWLPYRVDLSAYAGGAILLRFDMVTLPGRTDHGVAIDDIAIDVIEYADSAPSDTDWTFNGWTRTTNTVPQSWLVQAITIGAEDTPARVRRLLDWESDAASGAWTLDVAAGEALLVIVSAVGEETDATGRYNLSIISTE